MGLGSLLGGEGAAKEALPPGGGGGGAVRGRQAQLRKIAGNSGEMRCRALEGPHHCTGDTWSTNKARGEGAVLRRVEPARSSETGAVWGAHGGKEWGGGGWQG